MVQNQKPYSNYYDTGRCKAKEQFDALTRCVKELSE